MVNLWSFSYYKCLNLFAYYFVIFISFRQHSGFNRFAIIVLANTIIYSEIAVYNMDAFFCNTSCVWYILSLYF